MPEAIAQGSPKAAAGVDDVEEVVVTGSRIARAGYDTLEPATVISSDYIENRGVTNIADSLTSTPSFGTGQTTQGNQGTFNAGQSFVDRFGLGSSRTLTLVNGRRFVSTNAPSVQGNIVGSPAPPGLQVDLNVISPLLVERIDNLAIGGAPAYGSDAIAGVVNIILKNRFDGLMVSAQSGITERGDNFRANLAALAGMDFADGRGNVMLSVDRDKSEGVLGVDRSRIASAFGFQTNPLATSPTANLPGRTPATDGRVNPAVPFNTGNTDGIPNSVLIRNTRINGITEGGLLLPATGFQGPDLRILGLGPDRQTRLMFDRSGNLVTFNPPTPFSSQNGSGGDGLELFKTTQIVSDVDRLAVNLNASFDITPDVSTFVETLYFKGEGRELVDQAAYNSPIFGGRNVSTSSMLFSVDDPRLNAAARSQLLALGVNQFQLSRTWTDLGSGASESRNEVYRAVAGVRSDLEFLNRRFTLEGSVNYGRTEGNYYQTEVIQQKFVNALNATRNAAGSLVCNPTPAFNAAPGSVTPVADPACVVLDPFGSGRPSAEAIDYVTDRTRAQSTLEQNVFSVNLSTPSLAELWAGPVGFSIGFERRREFGEFRPDAVQRLGLTRNPAIAAASGSFTTNEVFGELVIPLVSEQNDIPLVRSLEFEGRVRHVDNSVNGGFLTYTTGGRYEPVRGVSFRGNFTRSLRAPAIVELFMPQAVGATGFPDPCDTRNIVSGTNPAIRQRNCGAFYASYGLNPATFNSVTQGAVVPGRSGGNPDLANETADAYTYGVVLSPGFLPKLSLAIDWNSIKVKGNIAQLTPADIAAGCYDNPDFDLSNPDAGNAFCTLFTRDRSPARNGQIVSDPLNPGVRSGFVNGAFIDLKALTFTANYRDIALDGIGLDGARLTLSGNFYYLDKLCASNNAVTVTCLQGTITNPRYNAQLSATYSQGPLSLFLEANYQPPTLYDRTFTVEQRDILEVESLTTLNAAVAFTRDDWTVRLLATNLFDTPPPFPLPTGDLLGRRYALRVTKAF